MSSSANGDRMSYYSRTVNKYCMRPNKPRLTEFGSKLATERRRQGLTVTGLANLAGISPGYLSQLETGAKPPTEKVIRLLSGALDINPNSLYSAVGIIVMPLAAALQNEGDTTTLDLEVTEPERALLVEYLQFLRFRAYMRQLTFASS